MSDRHERPGPVALVLTGLVVVAYFGFIVFAARAPDMMASAAFGAVPLSFVLAAALIVGVVAVTGLYVLYANATERRR